MVAEILIIPDTANPEPARAGARYMAKGLTAAGVKVRESVCVCESARELGQAVSKALSRSNVVAVIGGLDAGPGGIAKNIMSRGLDLPLETDHECRDAIRGYCRKTGEKFGHEDEELAKMPRGAKAMHPSYGKIPGCIISSASQHIILLPESQQELASMFGKYVSPFLSSLEPASAVTHVIRTYGAREEYVREKLGELMRAQNPAITLQAEGNEVLVSVSAYARDGRDAASLCAPALREIARRMGDVAYGLDVDSIQSAVIGKMVKKDLGLAIAESGTMGMFTRVIGETVGGQEILRYSTVAEDDEAKTAKLEIDARLLKKRGGVSEYAAVAMAAGARNKSGTNIGVGIAANASDFEDKKSFPGLVFIAVCDRENVYVKKLVVGDGGAPDDVIIDAAVSRALNMLRLFVDYLPGMYKGCVNLAGVLEGKIRVTDRDSYEDDINNSYAGENARSFGGMGGTGRKVKKIVLTVAIIVFLGCGGYLGLNYYQSYAAQRQAQTLQGLYEYENIEDADIREDFPEEYLNGFGPLWSINSDIVGFIYLEGTQVKYPVVQASDNEYYLRRDFYGNKSEHGIPFMDYRVDIERPSENMVIYGHNMKDGQIFGELLGYKTLDYYKNHPTINFDTLYGKGEYRIYSVFITNVVESQGPVFPYHNFINSASDEDFINYVKQLKIRSIIDTGVDVVPGDELLTLSTCTYEFEDARFVIAARKLREGERSDDGADAATMNRQPLYPDIWYKTFGGEKPDGIENNATVTTRPMNNTAPPADSGEAPPHVSGDLVVAVSSQAPHVSSTIHTASSSLSAQEIAAQSKAASDAAAQSMAAQSKAASDAAAQSMAAQSKAASDAAAQSMAAQSKAASDAAAQSMAAQSKAASDAAAAAASSRSAAETEAANAAVSALAAVKKAESAAERVVNTDSTEEAGYDLELAWDAAAETMSYADEASEAAARAGTEAAKKSAASAESYASRAERAFQKAEEYYIELSEYEKSTPQKSQSGSGQGSSSAGTAVSSGGGKLTVTSGGQKVTGDALDIVSRIVQNEMGTSFHKEALKAQAVAAYTYIYFHNLSGNSPSMIMSSKADNKIVSAVSEVLGQMVYYNGKAAFTPFFSTSAGATTSSASVWGGSYPYLVSVDSSVDASVSNFKYTVSFTRDKVESLIYSKLGIRVEGDPSDWFEVLSLTDGGYNADMAVCGRTKSSSGTKITGRVLREQVFNLRSACFDVDYDYSSDKFLFTTYGYGHGAGMSQNGANLYASREGWSYIDILNHYYPGTSVK